MSDESILDYLRSRGRVDPPAGLIDDIVRAVDAIPQRRAWFAPLVPIAAAVAAVALVVVIAILVGQPPAGGPPAASCARGDWPATAISCETAVKIGDQAGARVERTRIWLTTLGAVKSAMAPTRQVTEPGETAEVWVIVYDGFWRCCPNELDEKGAVIPQVDQMRWLVVAEAAREGTRFIYLQDWTGKPVPDLLPVREPPASESGPPQSSPSAASLTHAGALATMPALDSSGQWGTIALERGADLGGYRSTATGGAVGPEADVSSLYFKNDLDAFYFDVAVTYTADRLPDPAEFGRDDWSLHVAGGSTNALTIKPMDRPPTLFNGMGTFPGALEIIGQPIRGDLVFAVRRTAADASIQLVYSPAGRDPSAWILAVREPGAAPQPVPSVIPPTGAPYVERSGLPFSVIASDSADMLFGTPDTCTSPAGYTVTYPDSWYTNTAIGDVPACSWFSPVFYVVDDPTKVPDQVVITMSSRDGVGGVGSFGGEQNVLHDSLQVARRQTNRNEDIQVGEGSPGSGAYVYKYLVTVSGKLPNDDNSARLLFASTSWQVDDDPAAYLLNKAVLDRIMASITFSGDLAAADPGRGRAP